MPTATAPTPQNPTAAPQAAGLVQVQPYLSFNGRADEALGFYRSALGAEITALMRFRDAPPQPGNEMCTPPANIGDKVMHASFRVGATEVLATDGECSDNKAFQNMSLALTVKTPADAKRCFDALADGGQVMMPLGATFFSPAFGMLADKFGVAWMVYVAPQS